MAFTYILLIEFNILKQEANSVEFKYNIVVFDLWDFFIPEFILKKYINYVVL